MRLGRLFPIVAALSASVPLAVLAGACSDSSPADVDGADATTGDGAADAKKDGPSDGGTSKEGGNCTAVKGDCDLVLQDCPDDSKGNKQECVVQGSASSLTTRCVPYQPSQQLPKGRSCCPGADNPCLPGLSCVGDPCVDGGPITGRCSPACCEGDDQACGQSDPEGIAGACDITLFVDDDVEVHRVCSYRERCKPFQEEPCTAGKACLIEDKLGTAGCINSFNKAVGEPCRFGNDCADGLLCLTLAGQDGGICRMQCLTPNAVHPFDASVEDGGPLRGGCPAGQACDIGPFNDLPPWLSFCRIDGG